MASHRLDLEAIIDLIPPKARVLDLGCGDGLLLSLLVQRRRALARGVELIEANVRACIARGLSVRQGNIEEGLADYGDGAFDYVILSETLAYLDRPLPVCAEMLRVGKRVVISFHNAGYWVDRWRALRGSGTGHDLCSGEPRARAITLSQFVKFASCAGARVEQRVFVGDRGRVRRWPALFARIAVYVISKS